MRHPRSCLPGTLLAGACVFFGAAAGELDPSAGLVALEQAVANDPTDVDARRRLGFELQRRGRASEALEQFRRVARLDPGTRSSFELAVAFSNAGHFDEAQKIYLDLLAESPNHPRVLHNLATIAIRRDDFETALGYLQRTIEADPGYMLAHFNLGYVLDRTGSREQAYAVYMAILEMRPSNASEQRTYHDAVQKAANCALALGKPAEAENLLSQLLEVEPNRAEARYARAQALMQLGRQEEARQELEVHAKLLAERKATSAAASGY